MAVLQNIPALALAMIKILAAVSLRRNSVGTYVVNAGWPDTCASSSTLIIIRRLKDRHLTGLLFGDCRPPLLLPIHRLSF